ncbi:DUF4249 domain-containing protein [Pedobacter sp. PWIIR3]
MKRYFLLTCICSLQLLMGGCKKNGLEDNLFQKPTSTYEIAVEGGYNTWYITQSIRLTKPASHPDSVPTPISKASVVVNDGTADIIYREGSIPGLYTGFRFRDPNYNGAYKLTIKYGGKTYTAVDTLRQVVNVVDDFLPISTRLMADKKYEVTIPKHTFGYLNPNKWHITFSEKLILPGDPQPWQPSKFNENNGYSYTHFLGSPNSLYPLYNLNRTLSVGPGNYIYIYKISLSERYAQYLYSVFMETDWNGLFSGVPVNIQGNISGNAQGYFSAVDVDRGFYQGKEL